MADTVQPPDLYEAMGGRLTSLNEQLAGFQQELAGMSAPEPTITPPNTSSALGQVGSVLADMFSPMAGIVNPVTAKQAAYHEQQLRGSQERRSILRQRMGVTEQQAQLVRAQYELEKDRNAQEDAPLKFVPGLISIKTPAAMQMAGQLMQGAFKRRGIQVPEGFVEGLIAPKKYDEKDINNILVGIAGGVDPAVLYKAYADKMDPETFQTIAFTKIPDDMAKVIYGPNYLTASERAIKAAEETLKTGEVIDRIRKRQGLGEGATDMDSKMADGIHRMDNNGQKFLDGTDLSQLMALNKVAAKKVQDKLDEQAKLQGLLGPLKTAEAQAAKDRETVPIDGGAGWSYNRATNQWKQFATKLERQDPAWISVKHKDHELFGMMETAIKSAQRLKAIIPSVLSQYSGDNLRQYVENWTKGKLGGDTMLNEFLAKILELTAEESRAISGSTAIRMGIFDEFKKKGVVKGWDTQQTARHMADNLIWVFHNRNMRILGREQMHGGQRLGPGKYWASPFNLATGVPDPNAPRAPIVLGPDEVSRPDMYIWESQ